MSFQMSFRSRSCRLCLFRWSHRRVCGCSITGGSSGCTCSWESSGEVIPWGSAEPLTATFRMTSCGFHSASCFISPFAVCFCSYWTYSPTLFQFVSEICLCVTLVHPLAWLKARHTCLEMHGVCLQRVCHGPAYPNLILVTHTNKQVTHSSCFA